MSRKLAIQVAACLLLAAPLAAQRRGGDFRNRENFRNPREQMQQALSDAGVPLSAEQRQSIEGLLDEQRQAMREFREQRRQSEGGERGRPDPQMFSAMREQMQTKLESVLTAEQQESLAKAPAGTNPAALGLSGSAADAGRGGNPAAAGAGRTTANALPGIRSKAPGVAASRGRSQQRQNEGDGKPAPGRRRQSPGPGTAPRLDRIPAQGTKDGMNPTRADARWIRPG